MHEAGIKRLRTPAFVHRLLDRDEWKGRDNVQEAIDSERNGLLLEGTWKENEIQSKESIIEEARQNNETIHLASLMTIVLVKGCEKELGEWKIKARIVFRGDVVRDQDGLNAIFQNLASSAPSSIAGLNTLMAFSMLQGNSCSTSDCVRAYIQSRLKTKHCTGTEFYHQKLCRNLETSH